MSRQVGPLLAMLLSACQSLPHGQQVLTVNDVAGHLRDYDGQTIRISGWLKECRGIECVLRGRDYATLSIASSPLDPVLDEQAPADVVLVAKVDASCETQKVICLDRVPELRVVKIERVSPRGSSKDQ